MSANGLKADIVAHKNNVRLYPESGHRTHNAAVRHKKERAGRNPKTGEVATVSARNVVDFKASQVLKNSLGQVEN